MDTFTTICLACFIGLVVFVYCIVLNYWNNNDLDKIKKLMDQHMEDK